MPFSTGSNARIRTNLASELAYNALSQAGREITTKQLRLSTGKRINNAADDVSGYITSRALIARNTTIKASINIVGDANNVTNIAMDALEGINNMLTIIKENTASASSGVMGTDEKIALSKASFRMVQQIQTIVDSTVFGGKQLLNGEYDANFFVGTNAVNDLITITLDLTSDNLDFNIPSGGIDFNAETSVAFGGVSNLNLDAFNNITSSNLGIFENDNIGTTLKSLADAIDNVNKVAAYLGGMSNRLTSQEDILRSQLVNYKAAISRIEDTDVAKAQLDLVKNQFLQQASLTSLSQSNANPSNFIQLIRQ